MTTSMRLLCTCLSVGLLAPACGDDSSPGGGSSTGGGSTTDAAESSSGGTTNPDPSTTSSSTTEAAESSSSGSAADSSSSGSLPESVSLGGQVTDFIGILGVEGLTVSLDIDPDTTVTTDADGMLTFEGLDPDTPVNFICEPQPDGKPPYAGGIVPERTGTADRDDVAAEVVQGPFIESQLEGLAPQDPVPADLDQAIVVVRVNNAAIESGTVTLTFDPEPAPGTFYAPNEDGVATLDSTEIAFPTLPAAVFYNLADTEAGDITITAEHSSGILPCEVSHPQFITRGGYITQVAVRCQ